MDHTLQKNSQPLRTSYSHQVTWSSLATAIHCAIAFVLAIFVSGCQTNRFAQFELPVPPRTLNRQAMKPTMPADVRMQSPDNFDNDTENRIKSLSSQLDGLSESPLNEQPPAASDQSQIVADLVIKGNKRVPTHHLTRNIRTRPGRYFDPDKLQQDVDQLWRMKEISRVNGPFLEHSPEGVRITIEVVERNTINQVDFVGNRGISDRTLKKETGLEDGAPLDVHQIRMAKTKIEEFYKEKGFPRTQVEILEGNEVGDAKVVFLIHEDQKQRIWKVAFEGNAIASDARLRNFIESKPGILKMIGGLVKRDEIEQDVLRLTNYYRSLGFFNARIGARSVRATTVVG